MSDDLYAVVEFNQASRQPEDTAGVFWSLTDAITFAEDQAAETKAVGRREEYQIYRLVEVEEAELWEWGLLTAGKVMIFVHEAAARRSASQGDALVKRRYGQQEWIQVEHGAPNG